MGPGQSGVNIQFSDKAQRFIKTRRLKQPMVLVNLAYRACSDDSGGGCGGGGCGGGSGCGGEGGKTTYEPYASVVMVDGGNPGDKFVKVDTVAGIPVYLAEEVFNKAKRSGNPLVVTLQGLVMKKLSLEGLDMTPSGGEGKGKDEKCH